LTWSSAQGGQPLRIRRLLAVFHSPRSLTARRCRDNLYISHFRSHLPAIGRQLTLLLSVNGEGNVGELA